MIAGIGIDTVSVKRFAQWYLYTNKQLERVFTPTEIKYCRSAPLKSAERFAARFAVKEALYKALASAVPHHKTPFLVLCRNSTLVRTAGHAPFIALDENIGALLPSFTLHVSLTHTADIATAFVIIERV